MLFHRVYLCTKCLYGGIYQYTKCLYGGIYQYTKCFLVEFTYAQNVIKWSLPMQKMLLRELLIHKMLSEVFLCTKCD